MRIESRCAVCQGGPSCGFVQFESTLGFALKTKHVEHFDKQNSILLTHQLICSCCSCVVVHCYVCFDKGLKGLNSFGNQNKF